jgi:hypothetical protein
VTTSNRHEKGGFEITEFSHSDFDISWVGCPPGLAQYWFGSDDGRILVTTDLNGALIAHPLSVAPSGDAINGIAWVPGLVAASTRSEVVLLYPRSDSGELQFTRGVFPGGAHGVAWTPSRHIIAPMGRKGLLVVGPKEVKAQRVRVIKPPDDSLNLYKVVSVSSPNRGEVLACAARGTGFVAMPLVGDDLADSGKSLCPAGADFVDVVSLEMGGHPYAVAALALDCSIVLARDLLDDATAETIHYGFRGERAYRILCTRGHIFLLTNRRLYTFVDLASRFLNGWEFDRQVKFHSLDIDAVDMSLAFDGSLLVVMPDCVYRIETGLLLEGNASGIGGPGINGHRTHANPPSSVTTEIMASFTGSAWERSENQELFEVQLIG